MLEKHGKININRGRGNSGKLTSPGEGGVWGGQKEEERIRMGSPELKKFET